MENKDNVKVILISDLWEIFIDKIWLMILAAILAIVGAYTSISMTYVPRYKSVATLYILQRDQQKIDTAYKDFALALEIVNDCSHLIRSHSVLDEVIKELGFNYSYGYLYNNIKIANPTDTRILEVTVESSTPRKAKTIVDSVCTIGTQKITEAMGFEQVYFYEEGILNYTPCNKTSLLTYLLIGVVAAAIIYAIFLFAYIMDDKIRTDEDIKNYLDLSILGDIPSYDDNKKKYGGRYYRSKYYRNKYYKGKYYQSRAYGEVKKK